MVLCWLGLLSLHSKRLFEKSTELFGRTCIDLDVTDLHPHLTPDYSRDRNTVHAYRDKIAIVRVYTDFRRPSTGTRTVAAPDKTERTPPHIGAHLMNTKSIAAFVLAAVIAAPAFADGDIHYPHEPVAGVAQPAGPTRAQVRAELVQLEAAGYQPGRSSDPSYPADIQAAEARVAAQNAVAQAAVAGDSGVGGVVSGSSQAGRAVSAADWNAMYSRH
jgi:hypothetical protein